MVVLSCLVMPLFHFKREMQCKYSKSCFAESVLHFVVFLILMLTLMNSLLVIKENGMKTSDSM